MLYWILRHLYAPTVAAHSESLDTMSDIAYSLVPAAVR